MKEFTYKTRGTAHKDWNAGVVQAEDQETAKQKLDEIYGVNAGVDVEIEFCSQNEFDDIEHAKGKEATHKPEINIEG